MLHGLGLDTGIDLDALAITGDWISKQLQRPNNSKTGSALNISRWTKQDSLNKVS